MLGSRENGKTHEIDSKPLDLRFLFGNMAHDDRMCNSATVPQRGFPKTEPRF